MPTPLRPDGVLTFRFAEPHDPPDGETEGVSDAGKQSQPAAPARCSRVMPHPKPNVMSSTAAPAKPAQNVRITRKLRRTDRRSRM